MKSRIFVTLVMVAGLTGLLASCDSEPTAVQRGALVYDQYCALCHGAAGEGYAADSANALSNQQFLALADDGLIGNAIIWGRPGTTMSAWGESRGGPLTIDEVDDLMALIRSWQTQAPVDLSGIEVGDGVPGRGQAVYDAYCLDCHGKKGAGEPYTSIANPVFLATASDAYIKYVIAKGREGTLMPAYESKLTTQGLDDLVALIRSWQQPVDDSPVDLPDTNLGDPVLNPDGDDPALESDSLYVKLVDFRKAYENGDRMIIIDARPPADYVAGHIKGAVSVPFYDVEAFISQLPRDVWIVAYCACPHAESGAAANVLLANGYDKVKVLDEGYDAWVEAELPVKTGPKP